MLGPIDASAGAITRAKSTGVSNGVTSSRGVRTLRAKRRRVSATSAVPFGVSNVGAVVGRHRARGVEVMVVVMVLGGSLGSGGEAVAGEAQVHVVEGRGARAGRG